MKGQNASMHSNKFKDWWGKRPYAGYPLSNRSGTNKFFKRQLHKVERQEGNKEIMKDIDLT